MARFTQLGELNKLGPKPLIRIASPQRIGPFDAPTSLVGLVADDIGIRVVFQFAFRAPKTPKTAFWGLRVNGPI